jgi:hypothetical protein
VISQGHLLRLVERRNALASRISSPAMTYQAGIRAAEQALRGDRLRAQITSGDLARRGRR